MIMNYKTLILIGATALAMMACSQQVTPQNSSSKVLGTLEVSFNDKAGTQAVFRPVGLRTQGVFDDTLVDITSAGVAINIADTTRNLDFVSRDFDITNNSANSLTNLTLVALEKPGNTGGAIKNPVNFGGNALSAAIASAARPTHGMKTATTIPPVAVDDATNKYRASFQALTSAEATAIQSDPLFTSLGNTGTVLEYGFVATNGNSRTIAASGGTGKITLAYRFPRPTTGATEAYSFTLTFVLVADLNTPTAKKRVTRSPEESTANANTRATALGLSATDEKYFIDGSEAAPITGFTRVGNVKISSANNSTDRNLLVNPGKLVVARIYNDNSAGGTYTRKFVEIFNAGEFSVATNGKSFQIGSGTDLLGPAANSKLDLLGILEPGQYRLLRFGGSGGPGVSPVTVTGDQTDQNVTVPDINGGKAAIASVTTTLNCAGLCSSAPILDGVGYSSRSGGIDTDYFEISKAPNTTTNTQSIVRKNRGCTDTNNNGNDFEIDTLNTSSNPARKSDTNPFICP
jgi:hypothetical protein